MAASFSVLVHVLVLMVLLLSFHRHIEPPEISTAMSEVQLWEALPTPPSTVLPSPEGLVPVTPVPEVLPEVAHPVSISPSATADIQLPPKRIATLKPEIPQKIATLRVDSPPVKLAPLLVTKSVESPKQSAPKVTDTALEDLKKELEQETQAVKGNMPRMVNPLHSLQEELEHEPPMVRGPSTPEATAPPPVTMQPIASASLSDESASERAKYIARIQAKIRRFVNQKLCDGKPELIVRIDLQTDGLLSGPVKLLQRSPLLACDNAIERAILQAQPLPLPFDSQLRVQFRTLQLKFRPNE